MFFGGITDTESSWLTSQSVPLGCLLIKSALSCRCPLIKFPLPKLLEKYGGICRSLLSSTRD